MPWGERRAGALWSERSEGWPKASAKRPRQGLVWPQLLKSFLSFNSGFWFPPNPLP